MYADNVQKPTPEELQQRHELEPERPARPH
jgi:hypothetical protein